MGPFHAKARQLDALDARDSCHNVCRGIGVSMMGFFIPLLWKLVGLLSLELFPRRVSPSSGPGPPFQILMHCHARRHNGIHVFHAFTLLNWGALQRGGAMSQGGGG